MGFPPLYYRLNEAESLMRHDFKLRRFSESKRGTSEVVVARSGGT